MKSLRRVIPTILMVLLAGAALSGPAYADGSHARIVRLSLVQGDVRFARDVKGDPLTEGQQGWENASLNLPIRQGYVVATDNGRAEVEFENGAMAFLAENTVLQFYDLSSEDGGFTTRLILRQGSAEFYVNPERGDYFSVTGGDFSVEAEAKATFRMNNFDDGSNVAVLRGRVTALSNGKNTELAKGQSLAMSAGEADSLTVESAPEKDEFDQWAAGRISTAAAATNAALQYTNGSGYVSGYGDLYTYGAWFPVAGYGYCWRPYGVGFGWSPFDAGSWYFDQAFGWAFLGGYSWGWLPYHYGGWMLQPGVGWVWSPNGTLGAPGVGRWRPVTGVWMRASTGGVAIVPAHPLDAHGKTPLNMAQGMFAVTTRGVTGQITPQSDARWKVENKVGREVIQNQLAETAAPARVSRTMVASGGTGNASGTAGRSGAGEAGSSIVYDRTEHRFVNSNAARTVSAAEENATATGQAVVAGQAEAAGQSKQKGMSVYPAQSRGANGADARVPTAPARVAGREVVPGRQAVPAANRVMPNPPSVPRAVTNQRSFSEGSSFGGGSRGAGASAGAGSSSGSARASAPAGSSSGGARSSGSSGGGGGRPH